LKFNLPSLNECGYENHEIIGAEWLEKLGFSDKVCAIVRNHVKAKRYICTLNKEYYNLLSEASKESFKL